jgi:hypothetical protein
MFAKGKSENTVITLEEFASESSLPDYNTECVFHAVIRLAKIIVTISYRISPARVLFFLFAYLDMLNLIVLIYLYDRCVLITLVPFSTLYLYNPCALITLLPLSSTSIWSYDPPPFLPSI